MHAMVMRSSGHYSHHCSRVAERNSELELAIQAARSGNHGHRLDSQNCRDGHIAIVSLFLSSQQPAHACLRISSDLKPASAY